MTKQIDIKQLIPFMKDGYVAMDEDETWCWYPKEPYKTARGWTCGLMLYTNISEALNIKPVSDWTKSLIKVENKDE